MECSCSCACNIDYEPPEFFNDRIMRARKEHKCCECGEAICIGEKYEYITGKWDGNFDTFKTCLPCSRIRKQYGCALGSLRDDLWECLGMDYVTGEVDERWEKPRPHYAILGV